MFNYSDHLLGYVREYSALYPGIWKEHDKLRSLRGQVIQGQKFPTWPDYVFCPISLSFYAYAALHGRVDMSPSELSIREMNNLPCIAALSAWRMTKSIYDFDEDLCKALSNTKSPEILPVDLLHHLPEWCVYISTPFLHIRGFFVYLEYCHSNNGTKEEIVFIFDGIENQNHLTPFRMYLDSNLSIQENIYSTFNNSKARYRFDGIHSLKDTIVSWSKIITRVFPFVLYLCSNEPDIDGKPANPMPVKVKKGFRLFPKDNVKIWHVGQRIGSAIRRSSLSSDIPHDHTDSCRARPRAHVRVAHWHTYLTGQGRVNRVLKWLHPVLINGDVNQLPVTIRPVQESKGQVCNI